MNRTVLLISVQEDLDVIGLKLLHNQLLHNNYESHLLFCPRWTEDAISESAVQAVRRFVAEISPLFIGISLMSVELRHAIQMSAILKEYHPTIPIVWGGIHPTITPESCLDYADFVCRGEAEVFILDFASALMQGKRPDRVGSLCFRRKGQVIQNPIFSPPENLDVLPCVGHVPARSYVLSDKTIVPMTSKIFRKYARYSGTTYSIMSSRGCPFSCTYCCNNALAAIYGKKSVRYRTATHIIEELERVIAEYPFIEYINFQDDCFLARPDREIEEFCQLYGQRVRRPFIARSIPTFFTDDKAAALKAAGLAWISLGLQSGSDRVCLDIYRRRSNRAAFLKAAKLIKQHELAAFYDVILDNPFETGVETMNTVSTLIETPKPSIRRSSPFRCIPAPNSERGLSRKGLSKTKNTKQRITCFTERRR